MQQFVTERIDSFKKLALSVLKVTVEAVGKSLEAILHQLDEELGHPGEGWESIGKRERRLTTLFGLEIVVKRRGYRRRIEGKRETIFPLDQALGIRPEERFCPLVQQLAIELATKLSFRETALLLQDSFWVPVSHQEVHRWVTEAGQEREKEERKEVAAAFLEGQLWNHSEREVPVLVMEADGVFISLQREREKVVELKLGIVHEGWRQEAPGSQRYGLIGKACWGGNISTDEFWDRGMVRVMEKCDPHKIQRLILNGDGEAWIREGQEYLGAEWHLDRYHVHRAILEGLSHDPERRGKVFKALAAGDLGRLEELLEEAVAATKEPQQRRKAEVLRQYLKANWDGLVDWRQRPGPQPEGARGLGAMEGQVRHIAAARMKRRGASWSKRGANNMLQLRLLAEMDRIRDWLESWQSRRWTQATEKAAQAVTEEVPKRLAAAGGGEWLRATLPLLRTKAGSSPLGRALSSLSHISSLQAC